MIELKHIRYILAAAERRSFRQAASQLGIHPSALARRIRDFEDEIGAALFIRTSTGINLTQAGERFVSAAEKAMAHIQDAIRDVGVIGRGQQGVVRIGLISSLSSGFLADLVQAFETQYPDVRLEYREGGTTDLISAVEQDHSDVAFLIGTPTSGECDSLHLWDERIIRCERVHVMQPGLVQGNHMSSAQGLIRILGENITKQTRRHHDAE